MERKDFQQPKNKKDGKSSSKSVTYTIQGITIQFPHKAYPSQISMMEKILQGLKRGQNCLLESPTGSGKTLALLCACLAWRRNECRLRDEEERLAANVMPYIDVVENEKDEVMSTDWSTEEEIYGPTDHSADDDDDFKSPRKKIFAAKGQQASTECERSRSPTFGKFCTANSDNDKGGGDPARPSPKRKIPRIFFGTRTHKQITQIIRELRKTDYRDVRMCILGSRNFMCIHPQVSKSKTKNEACKDLLDSRGCSFHQNVTTRARSHDQLVQYGVPQPWDIEDIVSAGNKIKACPYFITRGLMSKSHIVFCPYNYLIDPLIRESMDINLKNSLIVLDEAHNIEDSARSAISLNLDTEDLTTTMNDLERIAQFGSLPESRRRLGQMLSNISRWINSQSDYVNEYQSFSESSKVWTGLEFVGVLKDLGWGPEDYKQGKEIFNEIIASEEEEKQKKNIAPKMSPCCYNMLTGFLMILTYLYKSDLKYMDDFKIVLTKSFKKSSQHTQTNWRRKSFPGKQTSLILNFWCLNPAVAFSDFQDVHSIVLTSGTLSPMDSFESELNTPFKIKLEANHVINSSQVWVGVIGQSFSGTSLKANFRNADTYVFQDEIGEIVLKICQNTPHGVLCFLPSYNLLDKLVHRWQITETWNKLNELKLIVSEPRGSDKEVFNDLLEQFFKANEDCIEEPCDSRTGALLLAVCRGKISEGIDFADNNARAVITVGIPFPNVKDIQVDLKRKYNNEFCKSRQLLPGDKWYEIQAFRALNQALGRCIRHKNDWGALILIDERFAESNQYLMSLSKWVRKSIKKYVSPEEALQSLSTFMYDKGDGKNDPNVTNALSVVEVKDETLSNTLEKPNLKDDCIFVSIWPHNNESQIEKPALNTDACKRNELEKLGTKSLLEKPLASSTPMANHIKTEKLNNLDCSNLDNFRNAKGALWTFNQNRGSLLLKSENSDIKDIAGICSMEKVPESNADICVTKLNLDVKASSSKENEHTELVNEETEDTIIACDNDYSPDRSVHSPYLFDSDSFTFACFTTCTNDQQKSDGFKADDGAIEMATAFPDITENMIDQICEVDKVNSDGITRHINSDTNAHQLVNLNHCTTNQCSKKRPIDVLSQKSNINNKEDFKHKRRKSKSLKRRSSSEFPQLIFQGNSSEDTLDSFMSEIVTDELCQPHGICMECNSILLTEFADLKRTAVFPKSVLRFSKSDGKLLCNCSRSNSLLISCLTTMHTPSNLELKTNEGIWNAYWSEEDKCCFQMLVCKVCKTDVALQIKASLNCSAFETEQVWFLRNSVWICPKLL